jgi:hypothetical protein
MRLKFFALIIVISAYVFLDASQTSLRSSSLENPPGWPAFRRAAGASLPSTENQTLAGGEQVRTQELPGGKQANVVRPRPLAYVTFLYGDTYVLPARVMFHSLRVHQQRGVLFEPAGGTAGELDKRTLEAASAARAGHDLQQPQAILLSMVTADVSAKARAQLHRDGVYTLEVRRVRNPYTGGEHYNHRFDDVLAKLQVFALEQFEKVVYVDADTLVLGDVQDMFECGDFCAAFINPCHFNSGVMVIRPSQALFQSMLEKLAVTESYDGGDQGFLNVYFSELFYAPGFGPGDAHRGGPLRRLPFGYHLDHIVYYPRLQWEVPARCGGLRIMEFMGVPLFKPWQWWTYPVMDLSWAWHAMRSQLSDPYPPDYSLNWKWVALRFLGVYLGMYVLWWSMSNPLGFAPPNRRRRAPFLWLGNWFAQTRVMRYFFGLDDRLYLYVMVIVGMTGWLCTTLAAALCIPMLATPYLAVAIYIHFKVLFTFFWMICFGTMCMRRHRLSDGKHARGGVLFRLLCYALADASAPPIVFGIAWHIPWSSFFAKIFGLLACLPFYLIGLNATYAHLVLLWARQGALIAERERARSRSLNAAPDDSELAAFFSELSRENPTAVLLTDSPTHTPRLPVTNTPGSAAASSTRHQLRSP